MKKSNSKNDLELTPNPLMASKNSRIEDNTVKPSSSISLYHQLIFLKYYMKSIKGIDYESKQLIRKRFNLFIRQFEIETMMLIYTYSLIMLNTLSILLLLNSDDIYHERNTDAMAFFLLSIFFGIASKLFTFQSSDHMYLEKTFYDQWKSFKVNLSLDIYRMSFASILCLAVQKFNNSSIDTFYFVCLVLFATIYHLLLQNIKAESNERLKYLMYFIFIGISIIKYFLISNTNLQLDYYGIPVSMNFRMLYLIYGFLDISLSVSANPILQLMIIDEIMYIAENLNYDDGNNNDSERKFIHAKFENYSTIIEKLLIS